MWRLVLKNLKGRKAYNAIIVFAAALALTMVFVAVFMSSGIQQELERTNHLQEPDLAVVPSGTKAGGQLYLAEGPPFPGAVPPGAIEQIRGFPEVEAVTGQKQTGRTMVGSVQATLITFEPATDFVVFPWLEKHNTVEFQGRSGGIVLGTKLAADKLPEDLPELKDGKFTVSGRLRETSTFLDTAIFFPLAEERLTEPSWILLRLKPGVFMDAVINRLEANIAGIEVITRPEMLKTINDQLYGVLQGGGASRAALLVVIGALLLTGAMSALAVHERKREFGLLKAMGAGNTFIFRLVIGEAAVLGAMGGILGMALSAAWLLSPDVVPVLNGPLLPVLGFFLSRVVILMVLTVAVDVLTALCPALIAARLEPYAAIRGGE
jgi:putative ABC transport system permease protein